MKTYIVTGGAGFIGSNIARRLIKAGNEVIILDDLSTGFERNVPDGSIFFKVDISDEGQVNALSLPDKIDVIYHIAAQPSGEASFENPLRDCDVNFKATMNMLNLAKEKQTKRFLFASSMSVYGEVSDGNYIVSEKNIPLPASYYGCHKLASENVINIVDHNSDIDTTCFRLFNVYGYNQNMNNMKQGMVSIYMSYLLNEKPVHVKGRLDRFRDFIFVDDVVDVFIKSEENQKTYSQRINLGTGIKTTVEELLLAMLKAYGKHEFDQWVYLQGTTDGDIKGCVADTSRLKEVLDWAPRFSVEEGIKQMKEWVDSTLEVWQAEALK